MCEPNVPFEPEPPHSSRSTGCHDDPSIRKCPTFSPTEIRMGGGLEHQRFMRPASSDPCARVSLDSWVVALSPFAQQVVGFSLALAQVTECLQACEATESWDPAYRDPDLALHTAQQGLARARAAVVRTSSAINPEDCWDVALLACVGVDLGEAIDAYDLVPDRRLILAAWDDWRSAPLRIDSQAARESSEIIHRLFFRIACYSDAALSPRAWPIEMQDPDIDLRNGIIVDQVMGF